MDTHDELKEHEFRMNNPESLTTELCDVCLCQKEETRISPDEYGFVCVECIGRTFEESKAVKWLMERTNHTREEVSDWFNGLKII